MKEFSITMIKTKTMMINIKILRKLMINSQIFCKGSLAIKSDIIIFNYLSVLVTYLPQLVHLYLIFFTPDADINCLFISSE